MTSCEAQKSSSIETFPVKQGFAGMNISGYPAGLATVRARACADGGQGLARGTGQAGKGLLLILPVAEQAAEEVADGMDDVMGAWRRRRRLRRNIFIGRSRGAGGQFAGLPVATGSLG